MTEYAEDHPGLSEQQVPQHAHCPYCRSEPTDDSVVKHQLSAMGYLHDDVRLECSECGERWTLGIPIGEGGYEDMWCQSCDSAYFGTHRVEWMRDAGKIVFRLHLKCPNCYHFKRVMRDPDDQHIALVGKPTLTGAQDGQTLPDGYEDGTLNTDD